MASARRACAVTAASSSLGAEWAPSTGDQHVHGRLGTGRGELLTCPFIARFGQKGDSDASAIGGRQGQAAHASTPRSSMASRSSAAPGWSEPLRSASVHATRSATSNPVPTGRPPSGDPGHAAEPPRSATPERTTCPGTAALTCHGVPRNRLAARSRDSCTCSTITEEGVPEGPSAPSSDGVGGKAQSQINPVEQRT